MVNDNEYTLQKYFSDVQDMAVELRAECKEHGTDEQEAAHEMVDGSSWVIYYSHARQVLEYSDNDCAIFEQCGEQSWDSWGTAMTQGAYYAMLADLMEALSELPEIETCYHCDESYNEDEDHDCPEEEDDEDEEETPEWLAKRDAEAEAGESDEWGPEEEARYQAMLINSQMGPVSS